MITNRIDVEKFSAVVEMAKKNPEAAMKVVQLEGEWKLNAATGPQFEAKLKAEKGEFIIQSDEPSFLGGEGSAPNPTQYCIYGAISCYAASFAKWAAMEGVVLRALKIRAIADMDMSRSFGISQNDILRSLKVEVVVDTDADEEKLLYIKKLADERCPAYYCLTNPIIPITTLSKE